MIELSGNIPVSELIVEEHEVLKPKFNVIDFHTHFGLINGDDYENKYDTGEVVKKYRNLGVKKAVNLDGFWNTKLDCMLRKTRDYQDFFITFGGIDVTRLDEPDYFRYVRKTIKESVKKGIGGLKFFKWLSLRDRDSRGIFIPADDDRLRVIWETAAEYELPVLIHIADPAAFFRPVDRLNERYEQLRLEPEWSYAKEGFFKFEKLMEMQKNLLHKNPYTTFVIAHVGSYSENLKFVSECMDSFPNMHVDISGRISELGRQPYSSRKFFKKYQDRILFGTDANAMAHNYPLNYRFLETWDEYFDYDESGLGKLGKWKIYGIGLEDSILEKVYYKNAEKMLKIKA